MLLFQPSNSISPLTLFSWALRLSTLTINGKRCQLTRSSIPSQAFCDFVDVSAEGRETFPPPPFCIAFSIVNPCTSTACCAANHRKLCRIFPSYNPALFRPFCTRNRSALAVIAFCRKPRESRVKGWKRNPSSPGWPIASASLTKAPDAARYVHCLPSLATSIRPLG
jgi:hypothetical protein